MFWIIPLFIRKRYDAAKKLLDILGYSVDDVKNGGLDKLKADAEKYGVEKLAAELEIGVPTLYDIIAELTKPGRDPRDEVRTADITQ